MMSTLVSAGKIVKIKPYKVDSNGDAYYRWDATYQSFMRFDSYSEVGVSYYRLLPNIKYSKHPYDWGKIKISNNEYKLLIPRRYQVSSLKGSDLGKYIDAHVMDRRYPTDPYTYCPSWVHMGYCHSDVGPICGDNGVTYQSMCQACRSFAIQKYRTGACS